MTSYSGCLVLFLAAVVEVGMADLDAKFVARTTEAMNLTVLDEVWYRGKFYVVVMPYSDESSFGLIRLRPLHNGPDVLIDPEEETLEVVA